MSSGEAQAGSISPFLNAVAELVIDLSTALKQDAVYGAGHPIARHHRQRLFAKLDAAFRLQPRVELQFAGETILCQDHFLDRRNPIYRQLAKTVAGLGVAGISIAQGVLPQELAGLLAALNAVRAEHLPPERARARILDATSDALRVDFLRDLIAFAPADQVQASGEGETERLWKPFLLAVREAQAQHESVPAPAEAPAGDAPENYAEAVIDYLKLVDKSQRDKLMLQGQLAGVQLSQLMGSLRPELREQIVSSVLSSERVSPELRGSFVHLVGHEHLVEILERLNAAGRSLPAGVAGTMALLTLTKPSLAAAPKVVPAPGGAPGTTHPAQVVERLFEEESRHDYMPGEYQRKLRDLEDWAQRTAHRAAEREPQAPPLAGGEAERHFLEVAHDLLTASPEEEVVEGVTLHAGKAFERLFEATDKGQRQLAMQILALGSRLRRMRAPDAALPWERAETLGQVIAALGGKDADRADIAATVLAALGRPAVGALLKVFESPDIAIRHRAFNALVAMAEDPAPELLARLVPAQPWYVQRNVLAVLRERGDESGLEPAKRLWPAAHRKVRVEILHYLHATRDPDALGWWEAALGERSAELSAAAARLLLRWPWPEAAARLIEHVRAMPAWQVGSEHHLELLRVLARCGDAEARRYVEELPGSLRALPWRSARLRGELQRLLRGGEPSISG